LADKIAQSGYYVVVPDFLNNDPFVPNSGDDFFSVFRPWIAKHDPVRKGNFWRAFYLVF
jgi:dienelactone hydrolase